MGILTRSTVVLALVALAGDAAALQRGGLSTGSPRGGNAAPHAVPTGRIAPVPLRGVQLTPPPGLRRSLAAPTRPTAAPQEPDNGLRRMIRILMAEEKTTHLRRMEEFARHLKRATREGNTERAQELELAMEQEVQRHEQAMANLKALRPDDVRGGVRGGRNRATAGNGAPMPPKPCPQRTVHGLAHRGRTQHARNATPTVHAAPTVRLAPIPAAPAVAPRAHAGGGHHGRGRH